MMSSNWVGLGVSERWDGVQEGGCSNRSWYLVGPEDAVSSGCSGEQCCLEQAYRFREG